MVKKKAPPKKKKKKKPVRQAPVTSGDARTPEELEAAHKQIDTYRKSLAVDRRWLNVRKAQQRLDKDTLLGVPISTLVVKHHTVLTMDLIVKIAALVRDGSSLNIAARACGVGIEKMRQWLKLGYAQPDTLCGALLVMLDQAHALAEANAVSSLYNGKRGWRSSLAYLEKRDELLKRDLFVAEQEEKERIELGKAQVSLDVDQAALVMALLESAAPPADDKASSKVIDLKPST